MVDLDMDTSTEPAAHGQSSSDQAPVNDASKDSLQYDGDANKPETPTEMADQDQQADGEGEGDVDISESADIPTDPVEESVDDKLRAITAQQQVLATQYSYIAHTLTRALDARLALTLEMMDEAARTGVESETLTNIYSSHMASLQSSINGPQVVQAERTYQLDMVHDVSRKQVSVIWGDFLKCKNDLKMQMCDEVAAEMVALFREKQRCSVGELRALDWISNNLDVVHDFTSQPKFSTLTKAEIQSDLQRLKEKPSTVKEEVNLDEFDTYEEEPADFLHELATLAEQQVRHDVMQHNGLAPFPPAQTMSQPPGQAQVPPQSVPLESPQPQQQPQQQQPQSQPPQPQQQQQQQPPPYPTQPKPEYQSPQPQTVPSLNVPDKEREQVPISSHTTSRSRSRSRSKNRRHHSISPAPKRHRKSTSNSMGQKLQVPQNQDSPYQAHGQMPLPQPPVIQQHHQHHHHHQQQHQLPPPPQAPMYPSMMSPQPSYAILGGQQPPQMKMYPMQFDAGGPQQQQQSFMMPHQQPQHHQQQPMYIPGGYEQQHQHGNFPPASQWGYPGDPKMANGQNKLGFSQQQTSSPVFHHPIPGMMPRYYYPEQHPQQPQNQFY